MSPFKLVRRRRRRRLMKSRRRELLILQRLCNRGFSSGRSSSFPPSLPPSSTPLLCLKKTSARLTLQLAVGLPSTAGSIGFHAASFANAGAAVRDGHDNEPARKRGVGPAQLQLCRCANSLEKFLVTPWRPRHPEKPHSCSSAVRLKGFAFIELKGRYQD